MISIKDLPIAQKLWFTRELHQTYILPSCLNCENNAAEAAKSGVAAAVKANPLTCGINGQIPPLEVLVCGCERWIAGVPF